MIFWWLRGPFFAFWLTFCHSDYSANHQKLNIIPKMSISFFDDLGGLFFAFWLTFIAKIAWLIIRSWKESKNEHLNFWWLRGPFFCILVDFCHSDYSANHQKLNVIQKWEFIFWWLMGPLFAFQLSFITQIAQPIIRSWT